MQSGKPETNAATTAPFELEVAVQVVDLLADWKRVSLLANYFAEYVAYQFPQRERAENLLSTITNEVLEAVVSLAPHQTELLLRCRQSDSRLELNVKHFIKAELSPSYVAFVNKLDKDKNDDAYLLLLTSDLKPGDHFNQLGLTMLEHDFDVHLSIEVEEESHHFWTHVDVLNEVLSR
jgi:hypothetical protein